MGSFVEPKSDIDVELQKVILGELSGRRRTSVVSTNSIISHIRSAIDGCPLSDARLASVVAEASMLLGLVPVYDPCPAPTPSQSTGGSYGYGHRAHYPDPDATYVFKPGRSRALPVREAHSIIKL